MNRILRTALISYVIIQVVPVVITGVVYIAKGAGQGIKAKIVKDIDTLVFGKREDRRRTLRREYGYYNTYGYHRSRNKEEA